MNPFLTYKKCQKEYDPDIIVCVYPVLWIEICALLFFYIDENKIKKMHIAVFRYATELLSGSLKHKTNQYLKKMINLASGGGVLTC